MLTPRQHHILDLIVRLYAESEAPVGSKTLLNESVLGVSSATIRNEMVVLEKLGYIAKAHTSSGRIPSYDGYRYYLDHLIEEASQQEAFYEGDRLAIQELFNSHRYIEGDFSMAKWIAELVQSLTGYPCLVFSQKDEVHRVQTFKMIRINDHQVMTILITDLDHIESQIFQSPYALTAEDVQKTVDIINEELEGSSLEDAYQRLKLTIPMVLNRSLSSTPLDCSPLIEKAIQKLKGHHYFISGKNNLFDVMGTSINAQDYKLLFSLLEGSKPRYQMFEERRDGIEVILGTDITPVRLNNLALVTATSTRDNQTTTLGILGPSTMRFSRMIAIADQVNKGFSKE